MPITTNLFSLVDHNGEKYSRHFETGETLKKSLHINRIINYLSLCTKYIVPNVMKFGQGIWQLLQKHPKHGPYCETGVKICIDL